MKDNILNVNYSVEVWSVRELSKMLKNTLKTKYKIADATKYSGYHSEVIENAAEQCPEIYEYQNFFLLRREDESYILLDGFRRLLLFQGLPDIEVQVRVYDENDLSEQQLMKLMIMLNHTKFFGGIGEYYDRGFNLLFQTLFGVNVYNIKSLFEGYVTYTTFNVTDTYSNRRDFDEDTTPEGVAERLQLPKTIEDLRFLQDVLKEKPKLANITYMGSMLYHFRTQHPDMVFNAKEFLALTDTDKIGELEDKAPTIPSGVREREALKTLLEMYINIFKKMCGEEIEETYAEALVRFKKLKIDFKKKHKTAIFVGKRMDWKDKDIVMKFFGENQLSPRTYILVHPNLHMPTLTAGLYEATVTHCTIDYHFTTGARPRPKFKITGHEDLVIDDWGLDIVKGKRLGGMNGYAHNKIDIFMDLNEILDVPCGFTDHRNKNK